MRDGVIAQPENGSAGPAAGRSPDPDAPVAFALGWHLGELRAVVEPQWFAAPDLGSAAGDYLPAPEPKDRLELARRQVDAAWKRLAGRLDGEAERAEDPAADPQDVYGRLLIALWSADSRLGKALGLGRLLYALTRLEHRETAEQAETSLAETPPLPAAETPVDTALRTYGPAVEAALADLASALPQNAAHSVVNSLRLWQEEKELRSVAANGSVGFVSVDQEFREQGDRWRGLLSAEVAGRDLVKFRDYLGSIEGLTAQFWEVAKEAAARSWPIALLTVVLLVAGIAMLFFGSTDLPGAGLVLTAFGVGWKAIGGFVGKPIARGEQDLWDAQMDWTIAYRITAIPDEARRGVERMLQMLSSTERREWAHLEDFLRAQERPPATAHGGAPRSLLSAIGGGERK
jgi:hypothetical protein